jgi:hypothetical protein
MSRTKVKIKGITKAAFEAQAGVVHFSPNNGAGAECGAQGRKFADFIQGVTCKRCLKAAINKASNNKREQK